MSTQEHSIIYRNLDTDAENAGIGVVMTVAEIEGKDATDLPQLHNHLDGVLDNIFGDPPSPESKIEITFSYDTYRVTIQQNGHAMFVKTE